MTTIEESPPAQVPALSSGASVPLLASLSPSRAGDFKTCPLLFKLRSIDRLPERPSPAAARGSLVHAVLERLFDLPAVERTAAAAAAIVPSAWAALVDTDPDLAELVGADDAEAWFGGARELLANYFALEDPRRLEPAAREEYVEVVLEDGLRLRGYVDRLDEAPSGDLRVVDYKTGRTPGEAFEGKALFQMKFYALVLWRTRGRVPRLLQLMYLADREMLRYSPSEAELVAFERMLRALWAAIDRAATTGDWRATPSRLCDWCEHRDLHCTAWPVDPVKLADYERWVARRESRRTKESSVDEGPAVDDPAVVKIS